MSDVRCPKCYYEQEIDHDDGSYGYDEDRTHEQYCVECDYKFEYTTSISFHYEAFCAEGVHDLEDLEDVEGWSNCIKCDYYERTG